MGLPTGMMVGKALYEGILLNLSFAPFFIRCLQVCDTGSVPFLTVTCILQGCMYLHHMQKLSGSLSHSYVCLWCSGLPCVEGLPSALNSSSHHRYVVLLVSM